MEIATLLKDLLVGLAWPGLLVFVAIFFQAELRSRISDLQEAGPGGLKFGQPKAPQEPTGTLEKAARTATSLPTTIPSVEKEEAAIAEYVANHPDKDDKKLLIRELAVTSVRLRCELVFSAVFESQINLLLMLSEGGGSLDEVAVSNYIEGVKAKHPDTVANMSHTDYLNYMKVNDLIATEDGRVTITDFGTAFLAYALDRRRVIPRYN